jgi:DNA polymerase (family 10)
VRRRPVDNAQIGRALREMALFLEMEGVPFKPRAYEKAALAVESLERPLSELAAEGGLRGICSVPGVGKGIGRKIEDLLRDGRIPELEQLRVATPVDVLELTRIEGLGPKHARVLYEELGVRSVADLEKACREGRVRELPHFGEKSEQNLLRGVELLKQSRGRHPLGEVWALAHEIESRLRALPGVERASVAGSLRRRRETIGDLDFLAVSSRPEAVMRAFVRMPEVVHVHARGATKTLVRLAHGIDADLRVVPAKSFGAALLYFTGSKDHNVALRKLAQSRGLKLNEYGVFEGERPVAGRTEEEVYAALGLPEIAPELREDRGEIEAAQAGRLPELIAPGALRGDLQTQTSWTDGAASIEEMVDAARALGLEYIAITDHTRDLPMARGLDEKRLREQAAAIRRLDAKLRGFRVLAGAEVNIRRDGSLDVDDAALAELDVVGAAVHSHFGLPRAEATRRVVRAMENPHVDVLFHPTARSLGRREPLALDMGAVIAAAKRTGTALEIDAMPDRLDLGDENVRRAVAAGVALVIDSDAHQPSQLRFAEEFGVGVARRGWARAADVLNTLPVSRCLARLKGGRRRRVGRGAGRPR